MEQELLAAFVRGHGQACVALIEGEAGIGKTALWSTATAAAKTSGVSVLAVRPTARTASAYHALVDLVRPVAGRLDALPGPRRRALAAALGVDDAAAPPEPRAVQLALLSLLDALGPVLVAIDDWQWLDRASAAALEFVARRLTTQGGARLLATMRTPDAAPAIAEIVQSLPEGRVLGLPLSPLTAPDLLALIHARTGRWLPAPSLERLHAASAGNPLAALELARDSHDGSTLDVRELLGARLALLSAPTRELLRLVAALPAPTVTLVEAAATDVAAALEHALAAEILERDGERLRFAHPLYAAVVEDSTPPDRWRAVNRRLADVVDDREQRARHLALAATGPDCEVASQLHAAARHAAARGAPAAAAELAERAATLTPPAEPGERARRLLDAADAHREAGDGGRARRILAELADALEPGPLRADALGMLAWITTESNGVELAERALAEAGDDGRRRARIHLTLSNLHQIRGDRAQADRHARRGAERAERTGDPQLRSRAMVELAFQRFDGGGPVQHETLREAMRLEREIGGRSQLTPAAALLGHQLYLAGDLDGGRRLLEAELDRGAGNLELEGVLLVRLADLELLAGRWGRADEYAQRTLELAVGGELHNLEGSARWARAVVDAHLGRAAVAREQAERALTATAEFDDPGFAVHARAVLGFLALSLGDAGGALQWLEPLPAEVARRGWRQPTIFRVEPNLVEAYVLAGQLDRARAVQAELEASGRALERPWAIATALRCRGLIVAAAGDPERAIADQRAALDIGERLGQPFEQGRTLLACGSAERQARRRADARRSLESARAVFAELGAELWASRARAELGRLGGRRPTAAGELTAAERRVAELAADGRSNREIAAELVVTQRAVEAHLTRIYRKLGTRSRAQLARRLTG